MPTFDGKVEVALAPDRTLDPTNWTWTDLTTRSQAEAPRIRRGRANAGADTVQPASMSLPMDNGDGHLTPRNPESPYYEQLVRGTPVRRTVTGWGPKSLQFKGGAGPSASTPDAAALDITGDIAGAVELIAPLRLRHLSAAGAQQVHDIAGKWSAAGQMSWVFQTLSVGNVRFTWSADGTNFLHMPTTRPICNPDAGPLTIGWYLDVNVGGTSRTCTFYVVRGGTITDLLADPAAYVWETVTQSGTTSIFSSTSTLELGNVTSSTGIAYPGPIRRFILFDGSLAGTERADPDFTAQAVGAGSFSDGHRTWTIGSAAEIHDRHVRLLGELASVAPTWPGHGQPNTARVGWEVAGPLRRMRQGAPALESALRRIVTAPINADNVTAYWPIEDGSSATSAASPLAGVQPMGIGGEFRFASDSSLDASKALASISEGQAAGWSAVVPPPASPTTNWRVDILFKIAEAPIAPDQITLLYIDTSDGMRILYAINDTTIGVDIYDTTGTGAATLIDTASTSSGGTELLFDKWCIWSFAMEQVGGNIEWDLHIVPLEGEFQGTVFGFTNETGIGARTLGEPTVIANLLGPASVSFSLGHLIVSTGVTLGWLSPADTAYVGEPATNRIARLLLEQLIPWAIDGEHSYGGTWAEAIARGVRAMGPQRPLPLLTLLQECADVDHGYLGELRELLGIFYRTGDYLLNQTPALTFTPVQPFAPADDDRHSPTNEYTASRPDGSEYKVVTGAEPRYIDSGSFNEEDDERLGDQANWAVTEANWPEMRYPSMTLELTKTTGLVDDWMDVQPGDMLRAENLPDTHPPPGTVDQLLDGYTEEIGATHWTVVANGRPAGPWTVGVLDDSTPSTGLARLDVAAVTAEALDTTETGVDITITTGTPVFTTAAAYYPMDIIIGGEVMTASACSGAGPAQTLTVTRSVNGVVKSHVSGVPVHVYNPVRLAL